MAAILACRSCGLVQRPPDLATGALRCGRCHARLTLRPSAWPAALALTGLLLYPVAMWLPILRVEQLGYRQEAGVLDGSLALLAHGQWLVGGVVFLVSVLLPLVKLLGLLALTLGRRWLPAAWRAPLWHLLEWSGRWGMLDVLLVAILVAVIKIGDLAEVHAGPGAVAFTLLVLTSLAAAACVHPRTVWPSEEAS